VAPRNWGNVKAVDFLLGHCNTNGFYLPVMIDAKNRAKAQRIIDFFWSAATDAERTQLKETTTSRRDMRQILNGIQKGVVAYLTAKRASQVRKMAADIAWSTIENCRRSFVEKSDYDDVLVKGNVILQTFRAGM
jgi:hypothetical protein